MDEFQKSRITLLDIAADADVSRSTVSLVIRNVPSIAETHGEALQRTPNLGEVFPVVAIARQVPGLDYVGIDNAQGALLAIEHLYRIGHRRVAFLGANPNLVAIDDRLRGYQQAFSQLQLKFDPLLVVPSDLNRRAAAQKDRATPQSELSFFNRN
jgi:DNA-binding LacI/PurR family transcriptional regulator